MRGSYPHTKQEKGSETIMRKRLQTSAILIILFFAGVSTDAQAQKFKRMMHRIDSMLSVRYHRSDIDTMYITRPATKWTVRGRFNIFGAGVEIEGKELGKSFKSKMDADHKKTISIGVNYLGVSVSLSLNPAKMMGKYDDYELNLSLYNNRWGVDVSYQDAHNFKGWHEAEGSPRIDLPPEMLKMKSLNVSAYYAFNRRRFSYPAAFTQSYIQRRSAGSFFLALSGQGQHTETKGDYESVLKVTNIGIGGGYGYNWVPGKNWLLHISALPTFTVFSNTSLKVNGERTPLDYHFPEYIITARGAVIRNFKKMFVGGSMVFHFTNIGDKDKLAVYNNKWLARLFIGIRL